LNARNDDVEGGRLTYDPLGQHFRQALRILTWR